MTEENHRLTGEMLERGWVGFEGAVKRKFLMQWRISMILLLCTI